MSISRSRRNTLLMLALTSCLSVPLANAQSGERGGRRGGPPQEAFDACVDKVEGDACSFSGRRGDEAGICMSPPRGEEVLVCGPENRRPERGPEDDAEDE